MSIWAVGSNRIMSKILVTGLNPAWQKVLEFETLRPGRVNRAASFREFGSGKGQNVAIVLRRLGHEVALVQVVGGVNGERLEAYCREAGVRPLGVRVSSETRVCSTLIDRTTNQVTEVIEPFSVSAQEHVVEQVLEAVGRESTCDALVMSGTAPAGVDPEIYLQIARRVKAPLVVLDVVRELSPGLLAEVHLLKINADEFAELESRGLRHSLTLITDGPRRARVLERRGGAMRETAFKLPELHHVRNPIGAGDTVTAYLTHELLAGKPVVEAFREALAAGSASCLRLMPGEYDEEIRKALAAGIKVTG